MPFQSSYRRRHLTAFGRDATAWRSLVDCRTFTPLASATSYMATGRLCRGHSLRLRLYTPELSFLNFIALPLIT